MARILIVDDEANMRQSMQQILPYLGYEVAGAAADGEEAFRCADAMRPDLVLMDIVMPGSMDGIDSAKQIRSVLDIPVIFISGHANEKIVNRAKDARPSGYLLKPANADELKVAIEMALYNKTQERQKPSAVSRIACVAGDATKRKPVEAALLESQKTLWTIIDSNPDALLLTDAEGKILMANKTLANRFDTTVKELLGRNIFEIISEEVREERRGIFKKVLKTGNPQHNTDSRSGRYFENYYHPLLNDSGQVEKIAVFSREVTARKQAEKDLQESEELFRSLVDQLTDGIIIIDWEGKILFANATALKLVELDSDQPFDNINIAAFIHPDTLQGVMDGLSRVRAGQAGVVAECKVITCRGREKWVEAIGTQVHFKGSEGDIVSIRDITERKRIGAELGRRHKLESLGTLAGGIAHDFNNLLAVIHGYVELAKNHLAPENPGSRMLAAAEKATLQAAELTKRLITFSRGGEPVKEAINLGDMIKDTAADIAGGVPIETKILIEDQLWLVEVDEGQIRQVMRNLAANAMESMPEGGVLSITAENVMIRPEQGLPLGEGAYVKIVVEDTGVGISEIDLPYVFDPYFSTKQRGAQKGMGLGLSVCYSIINKHRGYITLEPEQDKGCKACFYLPAVAGAEISEKPGSSVNRPVTKGRVLVMDDEAMIRDMISQMLTAKDYQVDTAEDGFAAIELYRQSWEAHRPYDLVILDLTVKGGMGGRLTLERLRWIDPQVQAIILSGYTDDPVIQNYAQYGFVGAVTKPFALQDLLAVLKKRIHEQGELF